MAPDYINREERLKIVRGSQKGISEQGGLARCIGLYHIEKGQAKQRYGGWWGELDLGRGR